VINSQLGREDGSCDGLRQENQYISASKFYSGVSKLKNQAQKTIDFTTSSKTMTSGNIRNSLARSADFHSNTKAGSTIIEITIPHIMVASLGPFKRFPELFKTVALAFI
jgi:hypothetical protein